MKCLDTFPSKSMALLKKDSTTPETNIKPKNSPSRIAKTAKCLFPQITDLIKKNRWREGRGGKGKGGGEMIQCCLVFVAGSLCRRTGTGLSKLVQTIRSAFEYQNHLFEYE